MKEEAMKTMMSLGPKNEQEAQIFAVERFRVDIQHHLQALMNRQGITQKELAGRLHISEARVSQFFSDDCNITIKGLARIFHALNAEGSITSRALHDPPSAARREVTPPPRSHTRLKKKSETRSYTPVRSRAR